MGTVVFGARNEIDMKECNDCDLGVTDYGITAEGTCPWCERVKA